MRLKIAHIIGIALLLQSVLAFGEEVAKSDATGGVRPTATGPVDGEVRDVILLLREGPLHLRFRVSLNGKALGDLRQAYVDRMIATLDTDKDGKLTRDETDRSPLLRKPQRKSAQAFLKSLGRKQEVTRREITQTVQRVGGETVVYRQDVSPSLSDRELFKFLDEDNSGTLEREEMVSSMYRILERDGDGDECVSLDEFLPEPEPEPADQNNLLPLDMPERSTKRISSVMRDTRETLLPRRMIQRYDQNRDRQLSRQELGWKKERFEFLDSDGDGRLGDKELAFVEQGVVDVELSIDLAPEDPTKLALRVVSSNGEQADMTKRPDFARINFKGAVISFARRFIDPVATALESAQIEFNNLDVDGNGYLDTIETDERIWFKRGGFDAIDGDGDGKIFGEEMEQYVRVRGEPAATSCRVNVYDTGHGFFMALDRNGDGRVGVRERKLSPTSLKQMERDGRVGVSAQEPVKQYHVEFVRGSYQLFGAVDDAVNRDAAFQQRALVGPIWFQRMDRNGDGDISWREFFGPRDVFHKLDADHDLLIDPIEAAAAEKMFAN